LGIIGDPVAHSISPAMQQPALDALGINARYERWHTTAQELPDRIASLRGDDMLGANVTVPHKQAVMALVDDVTPLARAAGAVNTITNQGGRLTGDNTDVHGFATSLLETCPDAGTRSAVILGAGGAARAVVLALREAGVERITLINRSIARAEQLRDDLGVSLNIAATPDDMLSNAGILINATSVGWHHGEIPIEPTLLNTLPDRALVVDLTYRDTDLLDASRDRGFATLDGLGMLVHQGARAFERFTGQSAPLDVLWNAARAARAPRS
jgi:shikimate dehydrogenase